MFKFGRTERLKGKSFKEVRIMSKYVDISESLERGKTIILKSISFEQKKFLCLKYVKCM